MKIERTDPVLAPRETSHLKKKQEEAEVQGTKLPHDEMQFQAPLPRSLEPGNVPLPLRSSQAESHPDVAGTATDTRLAAESSVNSADISAPAIGSYPALTSLNNGGAPGDLSFEIYQFLTDNCRKWTTVNFVFDGREGPRLDNIKLVGSFNPATGQYDATWNQGKGVIMHDDGINGDTKAGDGLYAAQVVLDGSMNTEFKWGVRADVFDNKGKLVSKDRWIVMTEDPPKFSLNGETESTQFYAPLSNHLMGVHRTGDDGVSFRTWSPEVGRGEFKDFKVFVDIYNDTTGQIESSLPMVKDEKTGNWSVEMEKGWSELEGKSYQYSVRNSKGEIMKAGQGGADETPVVYSDPYSRYLQGQQRGLERIYVDSILGVETGWYNDSGSGGPNYQINQQWGRFTVNDHPKADSVNLILRDENGHQLTKKELLERIGAPSLKPYDQASQQEKRNSDILKSWQLDLSGKVTEYQWTNDIRDDGTIKMTKVGGGATATSWTTTVNNFPKLVGLKYEYQIVEDGKLVGDKNKDDVLQEGERKLTPFNDQYSNVISAHPGAERRSLIRESSFQFRNDDAPRKETDFRKYVIYEAHVGSFFSTKDNARPCTFQDMMNNLDYIEKTGSNSIELMPFNEFGGRRDWGYTPDFYFAGAEAYGFELPRDKALEMGIIRKDQNTDQESVWVSGTDAVKVFVDEAHKRGFNVLSDVVYNHTSGKADGDNPLWTIDGDKKSFFNWFGTHISNTPWGAKPNYSDQAVKDFYSNNAVQQVDEFHLDGIRFDFTQVLHDTGTVAEKIEGMNALRQINRSLQYFKPSTLTYTTAEDFTHNWLVAADLDKSEWQGQGDWALEKKGMGFSSVWNDSFHHDLLGLIKNDNPEKNIDRFMGSLLSHSGVSGWDRALVFSHNHDEVGNSGSWVGRAAARSRADSEVLKPYPRSVARSAAAITLTAAGVPMIFQGEEFAANNDFKHGVTSTWGADMSWTQFMVTPDRLEQFKAIACLPESSQAGELKKFSADDRALFDKYIKMTPDEKNATVLYSERTGIFENYCDLIKLRGSSPAFMANSEIKRVYTHNADRVMAFERKGGNDDFIVITNFADQDRPGYSVGLPPGNWKEVFNSNAAKYGGTGSGNCGSTIPGGGGVFLPAGSTVILKKQ